ncbi:hypothetical protein POM88_040529 [Heracleum sosnowskyi]|uniref:SKP1 component POZ domain-containing protein n=1 Tax=Heracleum sosnowskyi TaxID=360622 RepID=A0AAD8MAF6_9APIA|nr:hypothetical protein POM88_040529 [Heracleum sosnowskyi]
MSVELFLQLIPEDEIILGPDGVIPLSKSFVGVPLHSKLRLEVSLIVNGHPHTAILSFDPVDKGIEVGFLGQDGELRVLVKVTWEVEVNKAPIYDIDYVRQRNIMLRSADVMQFVVEEDVALEFRSLKDKIEKCNLVNPTYSIIGITGSILREIIYYSKHHVRPSFSSDDEFFGQRDLVTV